MYTTFCFKAAKLNAKGTAPLVLRITIAGLRADHSTGLRIAPAEWDAKRGRVRDRHPAANTLNEELQKLLGAAVVAKQRVEAAAVRPRPLLPGSKATAKEVAEYLRDPAALLLAATPPCFLAYCEGQVEAYYAPRNYGTYKSVRQAVQALRRWHGPKPLRLDLFGPAEATDFYEHLLLSSQSQDGAASQATAALKMRWLTALFNRGRRAGRLGGVSMSPFAGVARPGKRRQAKVRLSAEQIQTLENLPLLRGGERDIARNIYLLQFYLRGERIGATLLLRKENYAAASGQLRWQAQKRGTTKEAIIPLEAQLLLSRLKPRADSPFLLPLLPSNYDSLPARVQLLRMTYWINRLNQALASISQLAGFPAVIRTHSARHTFATLADRATNHNVRAVQALVGHAQARTTEVYLADLTSFEMQALQDSVYSRMLPPGSQQTTP